MDNATRSDLSRCLAKVVAYLACGKLDEAEEWRAQLERALNGAFIDAGGSWDHYGYVAEDENPTPVETLHIGTIIEST